MGIVERSQAGVNALEWQLLEQGFRPGVPPHVSPYTEELDAALVGRSRCPSCRARGRRFRPFRRGRDYRALACCEKCHNVTEW